jgi:hypothetical protein
LIRGHNFEATFSGMRRSDISIFAEMVQDDAPGESKAPSWKKQLLPPKSHLK